MPDVFAHPNLTYSPAQPRPLALIGASPRASKGVATMDRVIAWQRTETSWGYCFLLGNRTVPELWNRNHEALRR